MSYISYPKCKKSSLEFLMDNNYLLCIIYRLGLLMSRHVSNSSHQSIIKSLKLLP